MHAAVTAAVVAAAVEALQEGCYSSEADLELGSIMAAAAVGAAVREAI
jgi:hypothetical protein